MAKLITEDYEGAKDFIDHLHKHGYKRSLSGDTVSGKWHHYTKGPFKISILANRGKVQYIDHYTDDMMNKSYKSIKDFKAYLDKLHG